MKVLFKYGGYSSWSHCVYDCNVDGENEWIKEKRRLAMAIQYMMKQEINHEWKQLIGDKNRYFISFLLSKSNVFSEDAFYRFIFALDEEDAFTASEVIDFRL